VQYARKHWRRASAIEAKTFNSLVHWTERYSAGLGAVGIVGCLLLWQLVFDGVFTLLSAHRWKFYGPQCGSFRRRNFSAICPHVAVSFSRLSIAVVGVSRIADRLVSALNAILTGHCRCYGVPYIAFSSVIIMWTASHDFQVIIYFGPRFSLGN